MVLLRSLFIWIVAAVITFVLSLVVVIGALLGFREKSFDRIAHYWGWLITRISPVEVRVEGIENIRLDQPQIIASNHQSWYDVFVLAALIPKQYRFVAKQELKKIPLFGRAWVAAGHVSVDRSDRKQAIQSLERFGKVIREDKSSIVIFPEGTRSITGELQPFKKGAFMLALHTHVDIVPVAITGSRAVLKKGDWRVHRGTIIVRVGQPIPTAGFTHANRDELIDLVRSRMQELMDAPTSNLNGNNVGDRQHSRA